MFETKPYELIVGNNIDVLKTMPDNSVHSIVTDPPYEIGFMGKNWDATAIAYSVELWKECLRVLKPGGYLIAFGATRTYHRLVCAIEDSGFDVRNQLMWVFGTGFPKGLNIGKAIDQKFGLEREVIGNRVYGDGHIHTSNTSIGFGGCDPDKDTRNATAPASPEAKQWEGWNTQLKPAYEPICLAQKPMEGTTVENVLKHGVGGLNIDGCRIEIDSPIITKQGGVKINNNSYGKTDGNGEPRGCTEFTNTLGRYPANLIHDGSEVVTEMFPETTSGTLEPHHNRSGGGLNGTDTFAIRDRTGDPVSSFGDSGSASRFFKVCKQDPIDPENEKSLFYVSKPSKADRNDGVAKNTHVTVKPTELMRYLVRLVTPKGGIVLDPFNGSGSTGKACMNESMLYIGIDKEQQYIDISKGRIDHSFSESKSSIPVAKVVGSIKTPTRPIRPRFVIE